MTFKVDRLPSSLKLDESSGLITGIAPERGEYPLTLQARNRQGEARRLFKIVAGDTLALTPPMGGTIGTPTTIASPTN